LSFKDFKKHIRFIPSTLPKTAEFDVDMVFSHLEMKRKELSKWVIIVEEAHAYAHIPAFRGFLFGGRHYVRKMIAVTPQTDAFKGLETFTIFASRRS
jgi:hypothetical protein